MEIERVIVGFNRILEALVRLIVMSDHGKVKDFFKKVQSYCREKGLNRTKVFKAIFKKFICCKCKRRVGKVLLNCKHIYCDECLWEIINNNPNPSSISDSHTSYHIPRCIRPKCNQPIEQEKYQHLLYNFISTPINPISLDFSTTDCRSCSKPQETKYFFFECRHNCIFCESFHINQGQTYCSLCGCHKVSEIFLNSTDSTKCSICESNNIIEEYFSLPCPGHIHCFNCLQVAWSINKCLKCRQSISPTLLKSYSILYKQCDYCENNVLTTFICKKFCCKALICSFCQSKSTTCLFCSTNKPLSNLT